MSWTKDLEPAVVELVVNGITKLASIVIDKMRGHGDSRATDATEAAISEIRRKALKAMIEELEREAANQAAILQLPDALEKAQLGAEGVLDAFEPKGAFPSLVEPGSVETVE